MRRVVITGQGTVNALGMNVRETLSAFKEARLGIGALKFPDVERLSIRIGAQMTGYNPQDHFTARELAVYDRFTQYAILAAKEAMLQSGLKITEELAPRCGAIVGSAAGGLQTQDVAYREVFEDRKNAVHPLTVPRLMVSAAASHLSTIHNLRGPSYAPSSACASSNHAIGQAFHLIRGGSCTAMLAGGAESPLCFGGIKAWEALRVLSPDACRPFSANRNGLVQGEGSAIFVLEDREHARARGADILAEVAGFAMNGDAHDIVKPSRQGAAGAMAAALADARLDPDDIGYINAHGTGTRANDSIECAAIRDVFGPHAETMAVTSTKSMHGHLMGATGAVELLAVIMAMRDGIIAPTIGYQQHDPDCALDVVPNAARNGRVTAALSNAFAFGGLNAVLALKAV